ncbi:MAG: carboxypeptidase-like regulatory domain-containing protein [Holophagales bacterium]|nr:carboxypeptidase-like regulatory domain-containing protein [Holophagales bacterium]
MSTPREARRPPFRVPSAPPSRNGPLQPGALVLRALLLGAVLLYAAAPPVVAQPPGGTSGPGHIVAGRIVDLTGAPIEGAEVRLGEPAGGGWGTPASTTALGSFRIPDVAPGPVTVRVEAEGHVSDERELEIPVGGLLGLEIALEPGHTLSGIVLDADGFPLPEVEVSVPDERVRAVHTGGEGRFLLRGVPATADHLLLRARGRTEHREPIRRETAETAATNADGGHRITLSRGLDLSGSLPGLDAEERREAVVRATRLKEGGVATAESRLHEQSARFTLWGLDEGEWLVVAEVGERRRARRVVLRRDQPSPTLELVFTDAAGIGGSITLFGQGLGGLELTLLAGNAEGWITGRTEEDGAFHLEGPGAGRALLRIFSREHRFSHALVLDLADLEPGGAGGRDPIGVNGSGRPRTLDIDLRPLELEGRVLDAAGSPAPAVRLRLTPEGEAADVEFAWAESDAEGRFRIPALFLGPALLTAEAARGEPASLRLQLEEGAIEPVTLRLR